MHVYKLVNCLILIHLENLIKIYYKLCAKGLESITDISLLG